MTPLPRPRVPVAPSAAAVGAVTTGVGWAAKAPAVPDTR